MSSPILICAQPIRSLDAAGVAAAIASAFDRRTDLLELPGAGEPSPVLAENSFDERMRAAFAVIIAADELPHDLRGTFAGEVATRSRQAGVACHLISAGNQPEPFTARIYDLQTQHAAASEGELRAAARTLADLL